MWGRKKMATTAVGGGASGFSQLQDNVGSEPIAPMAALSFGLNAHESNEPSLREMVKTRLLTDMIRGIGAQTSGVIMCVDQFTLRLLSSTIKMSELLEDNIQLVENITMKDKSGSYLSRQVHPLNCQISSNPLRRTQPHLLPTHATHSQQTQALPWSIPGHSRPHSTLPQ